MRKLIARECCRGWPLPGCIPPKFPLTSPPALLKSPSRGPRKRKAAFHISGDKALWQLLPNFRPLQAHLSIFAYLWLFRFLGILTLENLERGLGGLGRTLSPGGGSFYKVLRKHSTHSAQPFLFSGMSCVRDGQNGLEAPLGVPCCAKSLY